MQHLAGLNRWLGLVTLNYNFSGTAPIRASPRDIEQATEPCMRYIHIYI